MRIFFNGNTLRRTLKKMPENFSLNCPKKAFKLFKDLKEKPDWQSLSNQSKKLGKKNQLRGEKTRSCIAGLSIKIEKRGFWTFFLYSTPYLMPGWP